MHILKKSLIILYGIFKMVILVISKVLLFTSLSLRSMSMGHKSGQCKEPGCIKEQWKDGYCRNCGQYAIQKGIMNGLTQSTKLLLQVTEGLKRVEENVSNLQPRIIEKKEIVKEIIKEVPTIDKTPPIVPNIKSRPKKIQHNTDTFIPSIDNNQAIPNIRDIKTSTVNKNMDEIAEKLSKTNIGG